MTLTRRIALRSSLSMNQEGHIDTVRVKASLDSLAQVRTVLEGALTRIDWPQEDASRLMLAAGEATCNAIEHGSVPTGYVDVTIETSQEGLTLSVRDEGDPSRPRRLNLEAQAPPSSSVRGRGIMIMRELADGICIEPDGEGTRVTMVFDRVDVASATRAA